MDVCSISTVARTLFTLPRFDLDRDCSKEHSFIKNIQMLVECFTLMIGANLSEDVVVFVHIDHTWPPSLGVLRARDLGRRWLVTSSPRFVRRLYVFLGVWFRGSGAGVIQ